jgi:hypothetical protein
LALPHSYERLFKSAADFATGCSSPDLGRPIATIKSEGRLRARHSADRRLDLQASRSCCRGELGSHPPWLGRLIENDVVPVEPEAATQVRPLLGDVSPPLPVILSWISDAATVSAAALLAGDHPLPPVGQCPCQPFPPAVRLRGADQWRDAGSTTQEKLRSYRKREERAALT